MYELVEVVEPDKLDFLSSIQHLRSQVGCTIDIDDTARHIFRAI